MLSCKFKDSFNNEGTCTLQPQGGRYHLNIVVTKIAQPQPLHFYGDVVLRRVSTLVVVLSGLAGAPWLNLALPFVTRDQARFALPPIPRESVTFAPADSLKGYAAALPFKHGALVRGDTARHSR